MTNASKFRWTSASRSDVGLVRKINEDACLDVPARKMWAVADGMGGHSLGDFASRRVVETLLDMPQLEGLVELAADARYRLQTVNRELRNEAALRSVRIIGSTVVALLADARHCAYLWAGDSRIYLCRNHRLILLTRDHSQVEELKARGTLSAEAAAHHPARNMITRAVGAADLLELDEETMEVNDGDMFLLCSDGVSNEVTEQEIRGALITGNCQQASNDLIDLALKRGGRDNITAVVVRADDVDSPEKTMLNPAL